MDLNNFTPNKLSLDNHLPELMDQVVEAAEHGEFKEAFGGTLIMLNHLLWRIQELEGKT